jgi:hypothetical protein
MKPVDIVAHVFEGLGITACLVLGFALIETAHADGPPGETDVARHELVRWKLPEASLKLLAGTDTRELGHARREQAVLGLSWQHSGGLGAWVDMRESDQPMFGLGWRGRF